MKVIGNGKDDVMQFQMLFEFLGYSFVTYDGTHDVACNGACRITVAIMVDGSNQYILETVNMTGHSINGNGESLFTYPALAKTGNVLNIAQFIFSQAQSLLYQFTLSLHCIMEHFTNGFFPIPRHFRDIVPDHKTR